MSEHIQIENNAQALELMDEGYLIVTVGIDGKAAAAFFVADGEVFSSTLEKKVQRRDLRDHVYIGVVGREEFKQLHFPAPPVATKDDDLLIRLTTIVHECREKMD